MDPNMIGLIVLVVAATLIFVLRRQATPANNTRTILTRLYGSETITVGATDGKATIAASWRSLFPGHLDGDFERWGTNVPGAPTKPQSVAVYEMTRDATFAQMFGSLGKPEDLCLSQAQILRFVEEHRGKLHPSGWATFFLFKVNGKLFVADVHGHGLRAYKYGSDRIWFADFRHRVVVPDN